MGNCEILSEQSSGLLNIINVFSHCVSSGGTH